MTNRVRYTRRFSRQHYITHNSYLPTPGEVLWVEFMAPLGLTVDQVAAASGINRKVLQKMIYGQNRNPAEFGYYRWSMNATMKIAHMFDTSIDMWVDIDTHHRLYLYRAENAPADLYNIKQVKKSALMKLAIWVRDQRRTRVLMARKEAIEKKKQEAANMQQQSLNL